MIRRICGVRIAMGLTGAILTGIPAVMVAARGDGLAYVTAAFISMLTLAGGAIAGFTWLYMRQDISRASLVRATGAIIVWHRAISGDIGATNYSQLLLPDADLPIKYEVAVLLRQSASVVGHHATFLVPLNDLLLFSGSVDYARRTGLALRLYDPDGVMIWQHPGAIWEFTRLPLW